MIKVLLIGAGGFLGVISRYGAGMAFTKILPGDFPAGTMIINFLGSLLIGFFYEISLRPSMLHENIVAAIMVGVLGGFTTFSTFSLETVNLLENGRIWLGICNMLLSVAVCVLAVFIGKALARGVAA